ncbi:hypothetical protein NP493_113g01029 [Ridgeia piscesae]|uniref:Uncharacterized protein n=1 Tax=Ridgeia piscesae TaxID=27915 RepID=A0AAD9UH09_RIDPI|nr:hypothetical protein NP493_113g01029 [Ridgeia piscesae]
MMVVSFSCGESSIECRTVGNINTVYLMWSRKAPNYIMETQEFCNKSSAITSILCEIIICGVTQLLRWN